MKKRNEFGFFLSETMVVLAVVAVVLLGVFKLFSSVYYGFKESETYNTPSAINALSNIQKYYESIEQIDISVLEDASYIELTNSSKYDSEYYTRIKAEYGVESIYLVDLNQYFSDTNNNFYITLRRFMNTLKNVEGVVLVIVLDKGEFAYTQLAISTNVDLVGNKNEEYVVYLNIGEEYVEPGYINWSGEDPTITWENEKQLDTSKAGTYYMHYDFDGYLLRRKVVVGEIKAEKYIESLYYNYAETNGLVKDDFGNIRYQGSSENVKNNIEFNGEIWRIIGIFDVKSKVGGKEEKRIKIVRDEILSTKMAWDTDSDGIAINQWGTTTLTSGNTTVYPGASLMQYLNGNAEGNYYYSLSSIAKGQIEDALWYSGTVISGTKEEVYISERSNTTSPVTEVNHTTTWVGKIGLIYPSDFGYAGTNCGDYKISAYSDNNSCGKTNNWLTPNSETYWTISPRHEYSNYAWYIKSEGYAAANIVSLDFAVRPSLYLKSNIEIISGNGGNIPYKISVS